MNIVRKSPAAGNSIMPPMANIVSGNTSVWISAALVATFSATLPGTVEASAVKASNADCAVAGFGRCSAFGDQQHAEHTDQQDGALQEQRRPVDVDGTGDDRLSDAATKLKGDPEHPDQRDEQRGQAQRELRAVARLARQERFDEHTGDGGAEDDQHRRQLTVGDAGRVHGRAPCATVGVGSGW